MFTITIDDIVNGFVIKVYDPKNGYLLNEFHEERIEVLRSLTRLLTDQMLLELKRRTSYASTM